MPERQSLTVDQIRMVFYEPRCEKTGIPGLRLDPTQTGLYNHAGWLEARNFVFRN